MQYNMGKLFTITLSVFCILLFVGAIAFYNKAHILSRILSSQFTTHVSVKKLSFSPMNDIDIQDIKIKNPRHFPSPYALEVGSLHITANYLTYLHTMSHIEKIELTNTLLTIDLLPNGANWEALMNPLSSKKSPSKSYAVIDLLTFTNLKIIITHPTGKVTTQTIPTLTLRNVKTKEGDLTQALMQAILYQTIFNVQSIIKIPLKITDGAVDSALESLDIFSPFK